MLNTSEVIALARKHVNNGAAMQSSAIVAFNDAIDLNAAHQYANAKDRAIKSLAYSVGVFHADYQAANAKV